MTHITYLIAAYVIIWLVLFGYLLSIGRKQKRLAAEIKSLKQILKGNQAT